MFDWLGRRWGVRCSSSQWVVCGFVGLVQVCGNINAQNISPMAITGPVIVSMDLVKEQKILLAPRTIGVHAAYYDTAMLKVNQSDADALGNSFSIMVPAYSVTDLVISIAK